MFKGVFASVIAWFTLTGKWDDYFLKVEAHCFANLPNYQSMILSSEISFDDSFIADFKTRCGFQDDAETREVLHAERAARIQQQAELAVAAVPPSQLNGDGDPLDQAFVDQGPEMGSVVLGGADASPDQLNFTQANGAALTAEVFQGLGEVASDGTQVLVTLKAKWPVNLRSNTSSTAGGGNPSQRILQGGECVLVLDAPEILRGQVWVDVEATTCP